MDLVNPLTGHPIQSMDEYDNLIHAGYIREGEELILPVEKDALNTFIDRNLCKLPMHIIQYLQNPANLYKIKYAKHLESVLMRHFNEKGIYYEAVFLPIGT